MFSTNPAATFK